MTSKSITLPRSCKTVTLLCAIIVFTIMEEAVLQQSGKICKEMEILDDLPLKNGMEKYLTSLEKIVLFAEKYKLYIDVNFAFGLFLINLNIRTIYLMKGNKLPEQVNSRILKVVETTDELMKYYQIMVNESVASTQIVSPAHYITDLFSNGEPMWVNHLQKFRPDLINITKFYSYRELTKVYSKWAIYKERIYDFDSYFPNPEFSDSCIAALAQIPVNHQMEWVNCKISPSCFKIILNGSEYGYAITHRLLYVLSARFARGCTIISGSQDKHAIDKFCAKMYNEAEYISLKNFELADLAMEQIALCTLEGHLQFLRRSWIDDLLDFQHKLGCFGINLDNKNRKAPANRYALERPQWEISPDNQEILGGICNSHTTAVAAGMLSATIRYIIEKFY